MSCQMLFVFTDFNCIALGPCFISLYIAQDQTPKTRRNILKIIKVSSKLLQDSHYRIHFTSQES